MRKLPPQPANGPSRRPKARTEVIGLRSRLRSSVGGLIADRGAGRRLPVVSAEIRLRPVSEEDLALLYRLFSDPAATSEYEWHGWLDPQRLRRQWEENRLLGEDGGKLMVVLGDDTLGFVAWRKRSTGFRSFCWDLGITLAPDARGHGHGTAAQRLLTRYLFAHTQVTRIGAETEITNIAEQRALEKAGFTREGVLRSVMFRDGQWHDGVTYSILRHEVDLNQE
jgi:RimJ/RimL family protein N-acetyltransferase